MAPRNELLKDKVWIVRLLHLLKAAYVVLPVRRDDRLVAIRVIHEDIIDARARSRGRVGDLLRYRCGCGLGGGIVSGVSPAGADGPPGLVDGL